MANLIIVRGGNKHAKVESESGENIFSHTFAKVIGRDEDLVDVIDGFLKDGGCNLLRHL